jgi:osmoprotectant transport system ATP-binding protein
MNIRVEGLCKRYASIQALAEVTLDFPPGETTVLLGPSGSGKSTLLRHLNRMLEPDKGRVLIDGTEASALDPIQLRRHMGYVVQGIGLFPHLSVRENIGLVPALLGWPEDKIALRTAELLSLVRLPAEYAGRYPRQLSGGEAQRVGVARALAADPPVLLMDEPFGALDVQTRDALQTEFLRIQGELKKTVVFVTHDVAEAVRVGDTLALLKGGRLVQAGAAIEFLSNPAESFVSEFFGAKYRLELLGRFPLRHFAKPQAGDIADFGGARPVVDSGGTLADALLAMLESGVPEVVVRGDEGEGVVRFRDLAVERGK